MDPRILIERIENGREIPGLRDSLVQIMHDYQLQVQSITKKHVPPVFQPYVFPVYLRNRLSYKESIYIFLYQFLKSFQLEQKFFKSYDTIS